MQCRQQLITALKVAQEAEVFTLPSAANQASSAHVSACTASVGYAISVFRTKTVISESCCDSVL